MRTMIQMVGASYRCRGISGATLGLRDCRRGVSVPARSLLSASILPEILETIGRSAVYRTVETINLWPQIMLDRPGVSPIIG